MKQHAEQLQEQSAAAVQPLVLIVDDDMASRKLMRKTLLRDGFAVAEAENGEQALAVFDERRPDIVLLDVEMPVMDGFTACRELRQREHAKHLPVLMVTGHEDIGSVNRAYDVGATDFITKPINWPSLGHRVRYLIRASNVMTDLAFTVHELDKSRAKLANAQRIARLGSWEIDTETLTMSWSDEVYRILGLDPETDMPSMSAFLDMTHDEDREPVRHWLSLALKVGETSAISHRVIGADGDLRSVYQQVEAILDDHGRVIELYGTLQDITKRMQLEDRIRELAYFDTLTGLPNRESFMMHVDQSIKLARRHNRKLAAMFLDLDDFKRINDSLGHTIGDLLLKVVAERLQECLRTSDVIGHAENGLMDHMVSRFGGDEFTILLTEISEGEDAIIVANRILEALGRPMLIGGHEVVITPTIGIAIFPEDGDETEILLKNSDTAMYFAKRNGKNSVQFFTDTMNVTSLERLMMENELRKAMEREELYLHYQPQLDLQSGEIPGVEALLRWQNEELGNVPPDKFIPMAEDSGLIIPIGEWILLTACLQLKAWQDTGVPIERMAVNISARQFMHSGFLDLVTRVLRETGLDPGSLELEITESLLMQDAEGAIQILGELKALGVMLAIDDFGTGYSSLSYLKRFPIDRLKVDQAFVKEITTNTQDAAITKAVIAMANSMDLRVIAEGVETKEQWQYLSDKCCHEIQGYYLSRPVPAHEIATILDSTNNPKKDKD